MVVYCSKANHRLPIHEHMRKPASLFRHTQVTFYKKSWSDCSARHHCYSHGNIWIDKHKHRHWFYLIAYYLQNQSQVVTHACYAKIRQNCIHFFTTEIYRYLLKKQWRLLSEKFEENNSFFNSIKLKNLSLIILDPLVNFEIQIF